MIKEEDLPRVKGSRKSTNKKLLKVLRERETE